MLSSACYHSTLHIFLIKFRTHQFTLGYRNYKGEGKGVRWALSIYSLRIILTERMVSKYYSKIITK